MSKGSKNEREARDLLAEAGYATYRPATVKYGENDPFGLFDILSFHVDKPPLWVQVKSNRASGVRAWIRHTRLWREHGIQTQFWVRYDHKGWRILEPTQNGHTPRVDERSTTRSIGEEVRNYLQRL